MSGKQSIAREMFDSYAKYTAFRSSEVGDSLGPTFISLPCQISTYQTPSLTGIILLLCKKQSFLGVSTTEAHGVLCFFSPENNGKG